MPALSRNVADWLSEHHGVVSLSELHALGTSEWHARSLVSSGLFVPVHRDVFRIASTPESFESRCRGACATSPDVVLGGSTSGRFWGYRRMPRQLRVIALVPPGSTPITKGVSLRRCDAVPPRDIVQRDDGIRLTSPPRTMLELAVELDDLDLESVIEQGLDQYFGPPAPWDVLRRVGGRGRPGSARLRRDSRRCVAVPRP